MLILGMILVIAPLLIIFGLVISEIVKYHLKYGYDKEDVLFECAIASLLIGLFIVLWF